MTQLTVHLYVFDTLSDWEPGYAVAHLTGFSRHGSPARYRVQTVGESREPVVTAGGITILPDSVLDDLSPSKSALLILTGGAGWEMGRHDAAVATAREFLAAGVPVAAICGATAGLARGGLLDNRQHTSNAPGYLEAMGYPGSSRYLDQPAVTDGDLITAAGTAPVDFTYHIFRRLAVAPDAMLDAWYGLYKTGDPACFFRLQALIAASSDQ